MRLSRTAQGAAWCRLAEQAQPPQFRQFDDPVVRRLLDPMLVMTADAAPAREQLLAALGPGIYGCQVMRTRYIDEVVCAEADGGITQVVILGAGLDTRAYRLDCLSETTVFEADLPDMQRFKQGKLGTTPARAKQVRFVPTDFNRTPLADALSAAGLDNRRPVLFVWEGVTQYLTGAAIASTLTVIGQSAPGSTLVFSYVLRSMLGQGSALASGNGFGPQLGLSEPWLSGFDPQDLPGLLAGFGLRLIDDVGDAEYQSRYLQPIGRRLPVSPVERVALAVV